MKKPTATIYAFVAPHAQGGHTRFISRSMLDMAKALRDGGIEVVFEPNDGSPIRYFVHKGGHALLTEPVLSLLRDVAVGVYSSLLAVWIKARLSRSESGERSNIVVSVSEDGRTVHYDHQGRAVSDERFRQVMGLLKNQAAALSAAGATSAPNPEIPYPVFLEHSPKIVGWTKVSVSDKGLGAAPLLITDEETWRRIEAGELRGMSVTSVVSRSTCSICKRDYSDCNHISGLTYDGIDCVNTIEEADFVEVSIVNEPVNKECLLGARRCR